MVSRFIAKKSSTPQEIIRRIAAREVTAQERTRSVLLNAGADPIITLASYPSLQILYCCSTPEPPSPITKRRMDADERKTASEANEARRQAMRNLLYRKEWLNRCPTYAKWQPWNDHRLPATVEVAGQNV
jgi:hypothetical protein